jgi:hypothetical protein
MNKLPIPSADLYSRVFNRDGTVALIALISVVALVVINVRYLHEMHSTLGLILVEERLQTRLMAGREIDLGNSVSFTLSPSYRTQ